MPGKRATVLNSGQIDAVYALICASGFSGISRKKLTEEINKTHPMNRELLDCIAFYLRINYGVVFAARCGFFKDRQTYDKRKK
ncbi:hypothetical protein QI600_004112 [Salmonella enterica]|nr:hypothetical protein [Salmonella enterica]